MLNKATLDVSSTPSTNWRACQSFQAKRENFFETCASSGSIGLVDNPSLVEDSVKLRKKKLGEFEELYDLGYITWGEPFKNGQ